MKQHETQKDLIAHKIYGSNNQKTNFIRKKDSVQMQTLT